MCVCMYGMIMAQYANHAKPPGNFKSDSTEVPLDGILATAG